MDDFCAVVIGRSSPSENCWIERIANRLANVGIIDALVLSEALATADAIKQLRQTKLDCDLTYKAVAEDPAKSLRELLRCEKYVAGRRFVLLRENESFAKTLWAPLNKFIDNGGGALAVFSEQVDPIDETVAVMGKTAIQHFEKCKGREPGVKKLVLTGTQLYDDQVWGILHEMAAVGKGGVVEILHAYLKTSQLDYAIAEGAWKRMT